MESVQRRFTKRIPEVASLSYPERLKFLGLDTLELRRLRTDLIETFKITRNYYDVNCDEFFQFAPATSTRGHDQKLSYPYSGRSLDIRRSFFTAKVVPIWNLPPGVTGCGTLSSFKRKLHEVDLGAFLLLGDGTF